jgi:hypothetical protein
MTNEKISLYTAKEEKELEKLMNQFDEKEIDYDHFHIETNKYILLCEGRKNRIRYNNITEDDIKNGFTPENFPYLTVFSKEYYPEKYFKKLQKLNKK